MKRLIGGVFLLLGILLIILSQVQFTGNVISEKAGSLGGIFGIILAILGAGLIIQPSPLERKVSVNLDRQQIKSAFRQWNGRLNGAQKRVLRTYGLVTEKTGGGHIAFYFPGASRKVYTSSTPSDQRGGLNFALKQLIPYIEENYSDKDKSEAAA